MLKIYIATSMPAGEKCIEWAKQNLPEGVELVKTLEESELLFSVFYNQLFPENFLEGRICVNFHAGILPFYRGSATFNWAIINGEKESGVTLHIIDKYIDHGPIIAIEKFPITENDTGWSLFQKSSETAMHMFQSWFHKIIAGKYTPISQDHTKARLYKREDFQKIKDLSPFVRAFYWPEKDPAFYINANGEKINLFYTKETPPKKLHTPLPNAEDECAYSFEEFQEKYIAPFQDLEYIFWPEKGFIVWRMSTGENAELLHVRTFVRGKGYSRKLVGAMIQGLHEKHPPYYSVFGFALASRTDLKAVYPRLGFEITEDIPAPYKGGPSFIFYQSFEKLVQLYAIKNTP